LQKNCGTAIAAMVLGIVGIILGFIGLGFIGIICGIVAVILGVVSKNAIDESNGQLIGRGMATAGLVLGIITVALDILLFIACASFFSAVSSQI
jgi:hypothetical protein